MSQIFGASGGGGSGNTFSIIQPDVGTSPTVGSPTDTLTLHNTDQTILITGNSSTKTITFNTKYSEYSAGNSGSAITIDWTNGPVQSLTLNTATPTVTFSNPTTAGTYLLRAIEDSTGSRTPTWPASVQWAGNVTPTLSGANKIDLLNFYYDGTYYYGSVATGYQGTSPFDPSQISGLQLWLDGNDTTKMNGGSGITNGTALSAWNDKSGNSFNASQASGALQPVYHTSQINGKGAVAFASQTMALGSHVFTPATSAWTLYFVMKFSGFGASNNFWFTSNSTTAHGIAVGVNSAGTILEFTGNAGEWAAQNFSASPGTSSYHIIAVVYNGSGPTSTANLSLYYDRTLITGSTGVAGSGTNDNIGSPDGTNEAGFMFNGSITAALVYNSALSGSQLTQLNNWVNTQFGI